MQAAEWVAFHRSDAGVVIDLVRAVAGSGDAGEYGDGVEVVIETPRPGWFAGLLGPDDRAQARIVVTRAGGEVGYPFDVRLVTEHGGRAAALVGARPGWAVSDSAGLAFLIQKGRPGARFDWAGLVGAAVAALAELRPRADDEGWRACVDRTVSRR